MLSYHISILVSTRNIGSNRTSDSVKRRCVSKDGENTKGHRRRRLQLHIEEFFTCKICKAVIERSEKRKHSFSSDSGLGT